MAIRNFDYINQLPDEDSPKGRKSSSANAKNIMVPGRKLRSEDNILEFFGDCAFDSKAMGHRLKEVRNSLNMSGIEFASILGLSETGLRKVENGYLWPSIRIFPILYGAFGVDIIWLIMGSTSTRQRILSAFCGMDDKELFDIFIRLYSYFSCGDTGAFCINNGRARGVSDMAKWENTFYRALTPDDIKQENDNVPYQYNTVDDMKENIDKLGPEGLAALKEYINSIK